MGNNIDKKKVFLICIRILFTMYILFMIYVLFLSPYYNRTSGRINYNIVPFRTIINYIMYFKYYSFGNWITNLFGNIIVFIPLGIFIPILFKKLGGLLKTAAVTLFASLSAEILQRVFMVGSFDVDDIILNIIGGVLGFLIYKFAK